MYYWVAKARYDDGTSVVRKVPYAEDDSYDRECDRQYELECWLLSYHPGCTWYSVDVEEES